MNAWLMRIKSFMNTDAEWHAFVIGWGDGVAFTKTDCQQIAEIKNDVHYYKFGVSVGRFAIVTAIILGILIVAWCI